MSAPASIGGGTSSSEQALLEALAAAAPRVGPNPGSGPGLTGYRLVSPQGPQWALARGLSVCCCVQGALTITTRGAPRRCGPLELVLVTAGTNIQVEVSEASEQTPCLGFVMRLDPAQIRRVSTLSSAVPAGESAGEPLDACGIGPGLCEAFVRLLRTGAQRADRRVLAPIRTLEVAHWLARSDVGRLLRTTAASDDPRGQVSRVIGYIEERIAEPLRVTDLARRACMSSSALSRLFREVTGVAPYQFVKSMRLDRASAILAERDLQVAEVARMVGFTDPDYFTVEFRRRLGITPSAYFRAQRGAVALKFDAATTPASPTSRVAPLRQRT